MSEDIMTVKLADVAYRAAASRLAELQTAHTAAERASNEADSKAATILTDAARGIPVTAADVIAARQAAEAAHTHMAVAEALRQAREAALHRAEVDLMHAKAAAMHAELSALHDQAADDARAADDAVCAARSALARLVATGTRLHELRERARAEIEAVEAAARSNSALASSHRSTHPKFPRLDSIGWNGLAALRIDVVRPSNVWDAKDQVLTAGVAAFLGIAPVSG